MAELALGQLDGEHAIEPPVPSAATAPEPGSCVLVGPRSAGKTGFLAVLPRAFEAERSPDWEWFVPGHALTGLSDGPGQTIAPRTYSFQLGIRSEPSMEITVLDTPGDFFGDSAGEESENLRAHDIDDLARASRNARCLVLCVPVQLSGGGRLEIARFLDRLLVLGARRLVRLGGRRWPGLESPWERVPRLELPFDRVLVLLTGIEEVCSEIAHRVEEEDRGWRCASPERHAALDAYRGLDAWGAAELIDSWALAVERVEGLDLLASSLKPEATMAICPVALRGLSRWPTAFRSPSDDARSQWRAAGGEAAPEWSLTPFGVWPSLLFIATGRAEAPVSVVDHSRRLAVPAPCSRLTAERVEE